LAYCLLPLAMSSVQSHGEPATRLVCRLQQPA
jgi:hypothetical protein